MSINWNLLQPVDVGGAVKQGFATGAAMVKQIQTKNALGAYMQNPEDPQALSALAYLDPDTATAAQTQHLRRQKSLLEQQERQRRTALGELYTRQPQAAREEAIAAGDFELADQFFKLDKGKQEQEAAFWDKAGSIAFTLKNEPDPQRRMALWQQAQPMLQGMGAPPEMLAQFDPMNDVQLDAAIATSQKVSDLVEQARVKWHQVGEGPSFATDFYGRPVGSQNPYAQGNPAPTSGPAVAPEGAPRAVATVLSSELPAPVVAGFLGNFDVEGGYTGQQGDGGTAGGISQLRGARRENFKRMFGKDPTQASPEEQARYTLWEMQNPTHPSVGMTVAERDAILAARTPEEAAALIDEHFLRSDGKARDKRVRAAARYGGAPEMAAMQTITRDQYASLPSGAVFIAADDPTRTPRRKP